MSTTRKTIRAAIVIGLLFCLIAGGWLWWSARPVGAGIFAVSPDHVCFLSADGNVGIYSGGGVTTLPSMMKFFANAHPTRMGWHVVGSANGSEAREIKWAVPKDAIEAKSALTGHAELLIAAPPDTLRLYNIADGRLVSQYTMKRHEVRCVSPSRDGRYIAWSTFKSVAMHNSFHLFISDAELRHVGEVDILGIYPQLADGSIDWGKDGALYFNGFDIGNHSKRVFYRVDPKTLVAEPAGRDLGRLFSISPDGRMAASAGSRGLVLTDIASGAQVEARTGFEARSARPAWSSDGRLVAFVAEPRRPESPKSGDKTPTGPRIVIADSESTLFTRKSEPVEDFMCGICAPAWTPDGKYVLVNGYKFMRRPGGVFVTRRLALVFDTATGKVSFPDDVERFWK